MGVIEITFPKNITENIEFLRLFIKNRYVWCKMEKNDQNSMFLVIFMRKVTSMTHFKI